MKSRCQLDPSALRQAILAVPGVSNVHELHVWQLGSDVGTAVGTVHVALETPGGHVPIAVNSIKAVFHAFNVHRTTIESGACVVHRGRALLQECKTGSPRLVPLQRTHNNHA